MIEALHESPAVLAELTAAYATGDAPLGEYLLAQALDEGRPWDEVCAAAARGIAQHVAERSHNRA